MAPVNLEHHRTHNLLLASKLLNQRETASPFTLVLDDLEQSARPLLRDCIKRAQKSCTRVIFVSLETLRRPSGVDVFVPLWQHGIDNLHRRLNEVVQGSNSDQRSLILIDCLNLLSSNSSSNLPALLSSYLRPGISLLAIYHTDMPLGNASSTAQAYQPAPLNMLRYLATTIISVHSFHHLLEQKAARDRGVGQPSFGLNQGLEGIIVGEGAQGQEGLVMELEFRRKSGRGVKEWYYLPRDGIEISGLSQRTSSASKAMGGERIILLEDHPKWRVAKTEIHNNVDEMAEGVTFNLGLTERQRQDREGVVLPYFDAQNGGGEGGRILYDIGAEDDFDEEEDEI
ncbi:hypothetical protein K461DRAFT_310740 [Myriangium duriaei CBS 260.36]|uniref:Elongator complex protein 5 n=1 Tax=Myriangium duriaei CBS 260.36 TaxID=1168546 RepID=A0A9P4MNH8_9PEZI|nr:hypothetical protein K461DRAFT_310740 [Myriangium duriaei CBS 260.36]